MLGVVEGISEQHTHATSVGPGVAGSGLGGEEVVNLFRGELADRDGPEVPDHMVKRPPVIAYRALNGLLLRPGRS
jgi:hypothetical protein